MDLRAETENRFLIKYLLIGLLCFGFFVYSAYDAFIGYPGMLPRAEAWQKLLEDESLTEDERRNQWKAVSEEQGWSSKRPTKKEDVAHVKQTIIWNYAFMAIGLAVAAPCLIWYFNTKGSWIEAKGETLRHSSGQEIDVNTITEIDKRRWEKKGIAIVHASSPSGLPEKFFIDDLKFERQPTDQIMAWVESFVEPDKIIGAPPEKTAAESSDQAPAEKELEPDATSDTQNESAG